MKFRLLKLPNTILFISTNLALLLIAITVTAATPENDERARRIMRSAGNHDLAIKDRGNQRRGRAEWQVVNPGRNSENEQNPRAVVGEQQPVPAPVNNEVQTVRINENQDRNQAESSARPSSRDEGTARQNQAAINDDAQSIGRNENQRRNQAGWSARRSSRDGGTARQNQAAINDNAQSIGRNEYQRRNQADWSARRSSRNEGTNRQNQAAGWRWSNRRDANYSERYRYTRNHNYVTGYPYWSPRPRSWFNGYIPLTYARQRYYYNNGAYYWYNGFGFSLVSDRIGFYLYSLPFGYRTFMIDNYPYYYANRNYYIRDHARNVYLQVDDPYNGSNVAYEQQGQSENQELFVYPNHGQTEAQLGQDKYECHLWAVDQTGYDPSLGKPGDVEGFQRAQCACLEGRGYTVK